MLYVVIIDSLSGIGRPLTHRLAAAGHSLVIHGADADELHSFAEEIARTYRVRVKTLIADLSDFEQVSKAAQQIEGDRIAALVANASPTYQSNDDGLQTSLLAHQLFIAQVHHQIIEDGKLVVVAAGSENQTAIAGLTNVRAANLIQAKAWSEFRQDLSVVAFEPGVLVDSHIAAKAPVMLRQLIRSVARVFVPFTHKLRFSKESARHLAQVISRPDIHGFSYFDGESEVEPVAGMFTSGLQDTLWRSANQVLKIDWLSHEST